ncbi:class I SAM-dependent DNA methyltransferase [Microbacterium sp. JZ37]|uniref:class I SAM-dependent DNA methyltransferase n=1 Tax=Microbacterium sp. JZ37 TaxID=2654193 RepID=UPI002B4A7962|nr:methyltransferase domain-containing protein [Microbacterium sp. JZ37]
MTVMPSDASVRDAYTARADEYVRLLGSVDAMAPADERRITAWARSVDGRIVDAGCGPGHWTKHLHDIGCTLEGVDLVDAFVRSARERFPDVTFRRGDLRDLRVDDGSLGGILAWYSLIHLDPAEIPAVLAEFERALTPGGSLLIGLFDGADIEPFPHKVVTAHRWPAAEMRRALEAAGFAVTDIEQRADPGARPHAAIVAVRPRR